MRSGDVLAMFGIMLMAAYLNLNWLLALLAGVLLFAAWGSASTKQHAHAAVPAGTGEEVLVPVTEDVGPVPWLYPPDFRIKVKPDWRSDSMNENATAAVANMLRAGAVGLKMAKGEWKK